MPSSMLRQATRASLALELVDLDELIESDDASAPAVPSLTSWPERVLARWRTWRPSRRFVALAFAGAGWLVALVALCGWAAMVHTVASDDAVPAAIAERAAPPREHVEYLVVTPLAPETATPTTARRVSTTARPRPARRSARSRTSLLVPGFAQ